MVTPSIRPRFMTGCQEVFTIYAINCQLLVGCLFVPMKNGSLPSEILAWRAFAQNNQIRLKSIQFIQVGLNTSEEFVGISEFNYL